MNPLLVNSAMLWQRSWRVGFFRIEFTHAHEWSEKGPRYIYNSVGIMINCGIKLGRRKVKTWDGIRDSDVRRMLGLDRVFSCSMKECEL